MAGADGAQQRAGERLARRELLGALHRLRALDRLDLLGQRRTGSRTRAGSPPRRTAWGPARLAALARAVAVDVQDAGQRGGARVDVLDRGAIEADPHHLAGGDERLALRSRIGARASASRTVPRRRPAVSRGCTTVGAQTTFQCPSRRSSATRVRYDQAPIPGTFQRSRTVASRCVAALRDVLRAGLHAGPVEAAAVGRQRRRGRRGIAGQRRRAAIVAARPRRHERVERLARARRRRPADEEDDDRRRGDQRQGAEGHHARDSGIGPGTRAEKRVAAAVSSNPPDSAEVSVPAPHTMARRNGAADSDPRRRGRPGRRMTGALARIGRNWRALSSEQRLAAIAAFALLLSMLLPWYHETGNALVARACSRSTTPRPRSGSTPSSRRRSSSSSWACSCCCGHGRSARRSTCPAATAP